MRSKAILVLASVLGLTLWIVPAVSASVPTKGEAQQLCEAFLKEVIAGDVESAFAVVTPHMPLPESELSSLELQTIKQLGLIGPRFGKVISYKFVKEENVGDFIVRYTFVEQFDRHVLRWTFLFYRPQNGWLLNSLSLRRQY